ncbi:MAG: HAMP domain-containing protein [Candidatus Margulisiibacteriota bacterium]
MTVELNFRHWSFPGKIMFGYLIGVFILTSAFSSSIFHISTIVNDYNNLMRDSWRQLSALQSLRSAGLQVRLDLDQRPALARVGLMQMGNWLVDYTQFRAGGIPEDFVALVGDFYTFRQSALKLVNLKEGKLVSAESGVITAEFSRDYGAFIGRAYVEIEKGKSKVEVGEGRFIERVNYILFLNVVLAPLGFIFLYFYGLFLANYTGLRFQKFLASLRKIVAGNSGERIDDRSRDELGQIAVGVDQLAERLEKR